MKNSPAISSGKGSIATVLNLVPGWEKGHPDVFLWDLMQLSHQTRNREAGSSSPTLGAKPGE